MAVHLEADSVSEGLSIDNKSERRLQGTKAELGAYSMDDLLSSL